MIKMEIGINWPSIIKAIITTCEGEIYKVKSKLGGGSTFELKGDNLSLVVKNANEKFSIKKLFLNDYIVYQDNEEIMRFHSNKFFFLCDTFTFNNKCYKVPNIFKPHVDGLPIFFSKLFFSINGKIKVRCSPEYKKVALALISYFWIRRCKYEG